MMDKLLRYGFFADEDRSKMSETFYKKSFKEVHIDTYLNEPYMLFSRTKETNVKSFIENGRLILNRKNGIVMMDIAFDDIENCMFKEYAIAHYQILFEVHSILYKLLVIF